MTPPSSPATQSTSRTGRQPTQAAPFGYQSMSRSTRGPSREARLRIPRPYDPRHPHPPKIMRNRFDQYLYDRFGEGDVHDNNYTTDEQLNRMFKACKIPESQWASERAKFDQRVNATIEAQGGKVQLYGVSTLYTLYTPYLLSSTCASISNSRICM